jgi:hypothetical protein
MPHRYSARLAPALALAALIALSTGAHALRLLVGPGQTYESLKPASLVAGDGDTIIVFAHTYTGPDNKNITHNEWNVIYIAHDGPEQTIIDGEGDGVLFEFRNDDITFETRIEGFTIRNMNSQTKGNGGAVVISHGADPIFENCVFESNQAWNGGATYIFGDTQGGRGASPEFHNCVFRGNIANLANGGAVGMSANAHPIFAGCLFDENLSLEPYGYGSGCIDVNGSFPEFVSCTFVENTQYPIIIRPNSYAEFRYCVIAHSPEGPCINVAYSDDAYVYHCIIYGNAGGDTVPCMHEGVEYVDPLFCDRLMDDYSYCSDSPCLAANNAWGDLIGATDVGCGECGSAVEPTTWGHLKALFRN